MLTDLITFLSFVAVAAGPRICCCCIDPRPPNTHHSQRRRTFDELDNSSIPGGRGSPGTSRMVGPPMSVPPPPSAERGVGGVVGIMFGSFLKGLWHPGKMEGWRTNLRERPRDTDTIDTPSPSSLIYTEGPRPDNFRNILSKDDYSNEHQQRRRRITEYNLKRQQS